MRFPCFFLEPTEQTRLYLRRYISGANEKCPLPHGYHDKMIFFQDVPNRVRPDGGFDSYGDLAPGRDDPRWPTHCDCGEPFLWTGPNDYAQVFPDHLYRRLDTGEVISLRKAPPGALWYAPWMKGFRSEWTGPDGEVLYCKTPGGDWNIDSRASNCTMPDDDAHRCWVRHGDPRDPLGLETGTPLHVDKNGLTCQAGAGSIQCGSYHGFLHGGYLTQ